MGDVLTLRSRRPSAQFDEDQATELERKIRKAEFGLDDFLDQLQADPRAWGRCRNLLGMIPGARRQQLREHEGRRARARPHRGDHPLDDAGGAAPPGAHQGLAAAAHREGLGHERAGRSTSSIKQFEQMRKLMKSMSAGQDARHRRADAPGALSRSPALATPRTSLCSRSERNRGSTTPADPRRRAQEPDLARRRRRSALPARRPRDRDDRALQRADRAVDDRARRGARPRTGSPAAPSRPSTVRKLLRTQGIALPAPSSLAA